MTSRSTSARSYNPWDQRLCLAPNGDLFKTIRRARPTSSPTPSSGSPKTGIKLTSGEELEADIIVTATGLNMQLFGGAEIIRNGEPIELTTSMAYKGMMLSDMPNMAFTIGYTNASWTLKADLVSEFVCRVLNYMDANGFDTVEPQHPGDCGRRTAVHGLHARLRAAGAGHLPKSGSRAPWRLKQNYLFDLRLIRHGKVDDEALQFTKHRAPVTASASKCVSLRRRRRCRRRRCRRSRPGTNMTPPNSTATSRTPSPVLVLLRGLVPSALMPMSRVRSVDASRTAPLMIRPGPAVVDGRGRR